MVKGSGYIRVGLGKSQSNAVCHKNDSSRFE
jgi:hypothetical protein